MSDSNATAGAAAAAADSASATAAPAQPTEQPQQPQSADSASNDTAAAAEDEQMSDAPAANATDDSNAASATDDTANGAATTDASDAAATDAPATTAAESTAGDMSDVPAPAADAPSTADSDSASAAADAADAAADAATASSAASSPRKLGRPVQEDAEPPAASSAAAAPAQPDSAAASAPAPRSSKHDIWMTAHEASVQNKKMKAHSGWKFVPVSGLRSVAALLGAAAGVDLNAGRTARRKSGMEDVPPSPQALPQEAPALGRGASKKAAAAAAAAAPPPPATPTGKKGSKRKAADTSAIDASLDEKQKQLAALAAQIEALKNQEQSILSGTPVPSTPMSYPPPAAATSAAAASPAPAEKKRKPTPVSIPSTPTFTRQPSAAATPGATPATPGLSRSGRNVKAPSHFADMESLDPVVSTTAPAHSASSLSAAGTSTRPRSQGVHLKSCRKLLEHLAAHKASQGIFAVPVNYNDPSKQFFAPNYLEAIGPENKPMNLGQVRAKLINFEYATMFEFAADVRMVYRNAMLYNPEDTWIHKAAADCMRIFEREIARIEALPERRVKEDEGFYEERDVGGGDQYGRSHHSKSKKKNTRELATLRNSLPGMQQDLLEQMTARILALEAKLQQSTPMDTGAYVQQPTYAPPPPMQPQYRPEREHTPVAAHRPPAPIVERERPAPAPRKSATPAAKPSSLAQPLSQHEKQSLKDDIFKLPPTKLSPVVDIISKAMPKSEAKDDSDEIEIDIDKLDIPTLRELQAYVKGALGAAKRGSKPTTTPAQRRPTTGGAAGPKTPAPAGPAAARATPAAASPAAAAASSVLSSAALQSPSRLDTPATPSMARGTSQAIGNTTPALKYDSSSDDSDSDSSSDSDDDGGNFTHLTNKSAPAAAAAAPAAADDTPAPTILDADKAPAGKKSADSSSDSDSDDDAAAPAWSNVAPAAIVPAATTAAGSTGGSTPAGSSSGAGGALWSDYQRTAEETRLKRAALSELESKQKSALEEQKASLLSAGEERRRRALEEEAAQAAEDSRAAAEKANKLAADREAARRAREARAGGAGLEEHQPPAAPVSMLEDGVQQEEYEQL